MNLVACFVLACLLPAPAPADTLPAEIRAELEAAIRDHLERHGVPGASVAMAVDGVPVWARGFGVADLEHGVDATAETVYRTASVGKTFTATAAMRLAESGRLDLDAPVQRYCPAFPEKRHVLTSRHLLAHTGGIRHYGGPRHEEEVHNTVRYDDVVAPLAIFAADPLELEPGAGFLYSTFGYNLLGCVIQGAAGVPYLEYVREQIFRTAGMETTRDDDPYAVIPQRSAGYAPGGDGTVRNARAVDMSSKLPAGGFVTTAPDLVRFAVAFMADRVVSAETRERMLEPERLPDGRFTGMGLGWGLFPGEEWYGEREAFHGGMTPGVSAMLYLLPDRGFAVAILMNLEGVEGRTALAAELARIALRLDADR